MCLAPAAAMEMEELQEADVLWPDHADDHQDHCHCHGDHQQLEAAAGKQPQRVAPLAERGDARRRRAAGSSAPVGISAGTAGGGPAPWPRSYYDSEESAAAIVPPHVVLAARRRCPEGRAASSVCVGQGRTLKGRDLQSVRTAVLRMTGFLET